MLKILLDDERIPVHDGWTIARDSEQFKRLVIPNLDLLTVVSFDHDLGEKSESGKWCLEWLVGQIQDYSSLFTNFKEIIVHSANRVGSENMIRYAENAVKHIDTMQHVRITWLDTTITTGHVKMPDDFDYSVRT